LNTPDQFGNSAFWFLYNNNRVDDALMLVNHGANINHIDNYGVFALKKETIGLNLQMVKRLLQAGADPNFKDEF